MTGSYITQSFGRYLCVHIITTLYTARQPSRSGKNSKKGRAMCTGAPLAEGEELRLRCAPKARIVAPIPRRPWHPSTARHAATVRAGLLPACGGSARILPIPLKAVALLPGGRGRRRRWRPQRGRNIPHQHNLNAGRRARRTPVLRGLPTRRENHCHSVPASDRNTDRSTRSTRSTSSEAD